MDCFVSFINFVLSRRTVLFTIPYRLTVLLSVPLINYLATDAEKPSESEKIPCYVKHKKVLIGSLALFLVVVISAGIMIAHLVNRRKSSSKSSP